jgi:uncharacterized protein
MAETNSNQQSGENRSRTSKRGFASMDPAKQKEIASKGGRAAHQQGVAHEWSSEEARAAGRKGGEAVSRNKEHMAEIGRKGGEASHSTRRDDTQNEGNAQA